jgi:hypothetical protein
VPSTIERVRLAVTLYTPIRELLGSNLGMDTDYPEIVRDFPQPLEENSGESY